MVSTKEHVDVARLLDLLVRQNALYRRLRLLADRQRGLVIEDDPQPLLSLLAERQTLVDGLVDLGGKLAPYRDNWSTFYRGLDESIRRQVSQLLEEANAALGSVLQSDGRDSATLAAKCRQTADRLVAMDNSGRVSAAYNAAAAGTRSSITDAQA